MAIVLFTAPITGIRGSVGGTVFSANGTSNYIRPFYKPSNPRTPIQSDKRIFLGSLPAEWRALTSGQRTGWNSYAAAAGQEKFNSLGDSYFASGFNWFCQINNQIHTVDGTFRTTFPPASSGAAPSTPILVAIHTPILDVLTLQLVPAEYASFFLLVFCSVSMSSAITIPPDRPTFIYFAGPSPGEMHDLLSTFAAIFGPLIDDSTIFITAYRQRVSGVRNLPAFQSTVVL